MKYYKLLILQIFISYFRNFLCQLTVIKTSDSSLYSQAELLINGNLFVYHINGTYVIENETNIIYEYEFDEEEKITKNNIDSQSFLQFSQYSLNSSDTFDEKDAYIILVSRNNIYIFSPNGNFHSKYNDTEIFGEKNNILEYKIEKYNNLKKYHVIINLFNS